MINNKLKVRSLPHSKPYIDHREQEVIRKVLESKYLSQGREVEKFENEIAAFIGVKYACAVSSGTSALHLALVSLNIKKGDEVIIPSFVCTALLNSVNYVGAKPVITDINSYDYNISLKDLKKKITRKTKAIILPHMFGLPADLDRIISFGIPVIEDCAHSIGANYKGKKIGSFGITSIFSFYATKMLCTGEGGMILTNNKNLITKIKDLREYDKKKNYEICFNYKITDLQAVIGRIQLKKINEIIKRRKEIARKYDLEFAGLSIELPVRFSDRDHVFFRYVIKAKGNAEYYIDKFKKSRIVAELPVFKPIHKYLKLKNYPESEKAWKISISIPIYPSLRNSQISKIIKTVKRIWQ